MNFIISLFYCSKSYELILIFESSRLCYSKFSFKSLFYSIYYWICSFILKNWLKEKISLILKFSLTSSSYFTFSGSIKIQWGLFSSSSLKLFALVVCVILVDSFSYWYFLFKFFSNYFWWSHYSKKESLSKAKMDPIF